MEEKYAQADLRFLLPVQPGQQVLLIGDVPILAQALAEVAHLTHLSTWAEMADLPAYHFDHIFIPRLTKPMLPDLNAHLTRLIRPGGWACFGVQNARRLHRLRFWKRPRHGVEAVQWTLRQCQAFPQTKTVYGVYRSLKQPEILVPLSSPALTRFFIERLLQPASRSSRFVKKFLLILIRFKFHYWVFNDMIIVTQIRE